MRTPAGRVLAACATPFVEQYDAGEPLAIVDATNPLSPIKVATYTDTLEVGFGCYSLSFAHSARFAQNGRRLYVS